MEKVLQKGATGGTDLLNLRPNYMVQLIIQWYRCCIFNVCSLVASRLLCLGKSIPGRTLLHVAEAMVQNNVV